MARDGERRARRDAAAGAVAAEAVDGGVGAAQGREEQRLLVRRRVVPVREERAGEEEARVRRVVPERGRVAARRARAAAELGLEGRAALEDARRVAPERREPRRAAVVEVRRREARPRRAREQRGRGVEEARQAEARRPAQAKVPRVAHLAEPLAQEFKVVALLHAEDVRLGDGDEPEHAYVKGPPGFRVAAELEKRASSAASTFGPSLDASMALEATRARRRGRTSKLEGFV